MSSFIEINNCKHYFLNEEGEDKIYFIHSSFLVDEDYTVKHPFGRVYKPKGCVDTIIRFVRQPNNSTLMFRVNEWNRDRNPFFFKAQSFFRKFTDRENYI